MIAGRYDEISVTDERCPQCGGGMARTKAGTCEACYMRAWRKRRKHGRQVRPTFEQKFWANVDKGASDECWPWIGHVRKSGYGQMRRDGNPTPLCAHRVAYELLVGPIPEGLHLDHLCRNRACVNPVHLEPVTNRENVRRGAAAKLSAEDVADIKASSDSHSALGRRFGVHRSHITRIRQGRYWQGMS